MQDKDSAKAAQKAIDKAEKYFKECEVDVYNARKALTQAQDLLSDDTSSLWTLFFGVIDSKKDDPQLASSLEGEINKALDLIAEAQAAAGEANGFLQGAHNVGALLFLGQAKVALKRGEAEKAEDFAAKADKLSLRMEVNADKAAKAGAKAKSLAGEARDVIESALRRLGYL
jgi:hypothetical protein